MEPYSRFIKEEKNALLINTISKLGKQAFRTHAFVRIHN